MQNISELQHKAAAGAGIQPRPGSVEQSASGDEADHQGAGPTRHGHEWSRRKAHPCLCNPLSWLPPFSCITLSFHGLFPSKVRASGLLISSLSESGSSSTASLHISWWWRKWHRELLSPRVWGISRGLWQTAGSSSPLWTPSFCSHKSIS